MSADTLNQKYLSSYHHRSWLTSASDLYTWLCSKKTGLSLSLSVSLSLSLSLSPLTSPGTISQWQNKQKTSFLSWYSVSPIHLLCCLSANLVERHLDSTPVETLTLAWLSLLKGRSAYVQMLCPTWSKAVHQPAIQEAETVLSRTP
jgi:hypothetical protein